MYFGLLFFLFLQTLAHEGLKIDQPDSLVNLFQTGIPRSPANFGFLEYGHRGLISGTLWSGTLHTVGDNATLDSGCSPLRPMAKDEKATFVVLPRGGCSFVAKVRAAQTAGAKAVIIINNQDEKVLPPMTDDGTGGDITIPSLLISKDDGKELVQAMRGFPVGVTYAWNRPHPSNPVNWDLWTSSDDQKSVDLKDRFARISAALGANAVFRPNYLFKDGTQLGCVPKTQADPLPCDTRCTNMGRYCSVDQKADISLGIDGARVVQENLRQLCVWQVANFHRPPHEAATLWFSYVNQYQKDCSRSWGEKCSDSVLTALSLPLADVHKCVQDSGGTDARGGVNQLIQDELQNRQDHAVESTPAILINNFLYFGSLSCPDPIDVSTCAVLNAICSSYLDGFAPSACQSTPCPAGQVRDACGVCGGDGIRDVCGACLSPSSATFNKSCVGCDGIPFSGKKTDACGFCDYPSGDNRRSSKQCVTEDLPADVKPGISHWTLFVMILIIIGATGLAVWTAMRRKERMMKNEIDRLLKNYVPLDTFS